MEATSLPVEARGLSILESQERKLSKVAGYYCRLEFFPMASVQERSTKSRNITKFFRVALWIVLFQSSELSSQDGVPAVVVQFDTVAYSVPERSVDACRSPRVKVPAVVRNLLPARLLRPKFTSRATDCPGQSCHSAAADSARFETGRVASATCNYVVSRCATAIGDPDSWR